MPDAPQQPALPPTHVEYGKPQEHLTYPPAPGTTTQLPTGRLVTRSGGRGVIVSIVTLLVLLPVIIGVIVVVRYLADSVDELDGFELGDTDPVADVHSVAGFEEMLDALRDETGSSTVFEAVLYPEYAVVEVPVDARSKRQHSYYWNGELRQTGKASSDDLRFDLSTIDPRVVVRLVDRAGKGLVENPTSLYVIIRKPQPHDQGAWLYAYASNEYLESGYLAADRSGKVVARYLSE